MSRKTDAAPAAPKLVNGMAVSTVTEAAVVEAPKYRREVTQLGAFQISTVVEADTSKLAEPK